MDDVTQTLMTPSPDDSDIRAGMIVNGYKVIKLLGEGGMGEVYLVENPNPTRLEALKILSKKWSSNEDFKARFQEEAQRLSDVDHENIVHLYSMGEFNGRPFFTMQFIEGQSLSKLIKKGMIPTRDAIEIGIGLCEGLKVAHSLRVIHRDIKPANVLIGTNRKPILLDFGIAKRGVGTGLTEIGSTIGTLSYMSPEQARGDELDNRSDIFSLGIVLYETLTGHKPFGGTKQMEILRAIESEDPEPLKTHFKDVPPMLQKVMDQILHKEVAKRYQDMSDVVLDLGLVLDSMTSQANAPQGSGKLNPIVIYSALAIFLAAIIWLVMKQQTTETASIPSQSQTTKDVSTSANNTYTELLQVKNMAIDDSIRKYAPEQFEQARSLEKLGVGLYQKDNYDSAIIIYEESKKQYNFGSEKAKPLWGTIDEVVTQVVDKNLSWKERARLSRDNASKERKTIASRGVDGIDGYLDAEQMFLKAGDTYVDGMFELATMEYDSVLVSFKKVLSVINSRDNANSKKILASGSRSEAKNVRANIENKSEYDNASNTFSKGNNQYKNANYASAGKSFESANKKFKDAKDVTVQEKSLQKQIISSLQDSINVATQKMKSIGKSATALSSTRRLLDSATVLVNKYYLTEGKQLIAQANSSYTSTTSSAGITDSAIVMSIIDNYVRAKYVKLDTNKLKNIYPNISNDALEETRSLTSNAKNISFTSNIRKSSFSTNESEVNLDVNLKYKLQGDKKMNMTLIFELEKSNGNWIIKRID